MRIGFRERISYYSLSFVVPLRSTLLLRGLYSTCTCTPVHTDFLPGLMADLLHPCRALQPSKKLLHTAVLRTVVDQTPAVM